MDQNLAEIDVATLADAKQLRLASGGILPRHDTEPCSEVSPLTEGSAVADGGNDGRGHDRSNAWYLANAGATRVCSRDPLQLRGEFFDLLFNRLPLAPQHADEVAHLRCQITLDEVLAVALDSYPRRIRHYVRWINHLENRIAYEKAMLAEAGGTVTDKTGPQKGGACQCWASHRGVW